MVKMHSRGAYCSGLLTWTVFSTCNFASSTYFCRSPIFSPLWFLLSAGLVINTVMDFSVLLQRVPALLYACMNETEGLTSFSHPNRLRALWLVNLECSRVAPKGLVNFTLSLMGPQEWHWDTNIRCIRLLRQTQLEALDARIYLAGDVAFVKGYIYACIYGLQGWSNTLYVEILGEDSNLCFGT